MPHQIHSSLEVDVRVVARVAALEEVMVAMEVMEAMVEDLEVMVEDLEAMAVVKAVAREDIMEEDKTLFLRNNFVND